MSDIPESIEARGSMVDSKFLGNGLRFDANDLAEMADRMVGYPFVLDHDMGVDSIAGVVTAASAETYDYEFDHTVNGEIKTSTRQATRIDRTVSMNSQFPAFERAARSIRALENAGAMPNTSMSISAGSIKVNEFDEFELGGPFKFVHDSHVSTGAFSHNEGVGLSDIQFSAGEALVTVTDSADSEGRTIPVACGVKVQNLEDLVVNFTEANLADKPELVAMLGEALGMDAEDISSDSVELDECPADPRAELEAETDLNTPEQTQQVETMVNDSHVHEAPVEGEAPTTEVAAEMAGASEDVVNRTEFEELRAELSAIKAEKEAAEAAVFDSKVAELSAKHPELEAKLAVCETMAQLELVAELAGRKSNPLPPETFRTQFAATAPEIKGGPAQAQSWHEARIAKLTGGN